MADEEKRASEPVISSLPVEPEVLISYRILYLIPESELQGPGGVHLIIPDTWTPYATAHSEPATRAALAELREASPSFKWKASKHELIIQDLDW
jgi:hypothetical protein